MLDRTKNPGSSGEPLYADVTTVLSEAFGAGDLAKQTTQVMHNLGKALAAAGATFADVVKITTYVVGYTPEMRPVIAAARSPHFPAGKPPASTLVGVQALAAPGWLIEIEATAVIA